MLLITSHRKGPRENLMTETIAPLVQEPEPPPRVLTPAAQRALAEAAERRRLRDATASSQPPEHGGRDGPDPVRFGDWEKNGIAWDF